MNLKATILALIAAVVFAGVPLATVDAHAPSQPGQTQTPHTEQVAPTGSHSEPSNGSRV
ncbi:hypothetical protein [Levilactobacillus bambusae]|uniref:hypothetical protein n=1 Tax=Levilactobacillus bambusae TaxID=2024736 RepID=UPI0014031979|nr:hypothetical protein [Levilactobacillus bambusae]